jgi:hypothetical protein
MMAECRPVEAPEFALRSADDHAAGRVGEAVELTISPSASRNASSILSSVVVISARSRLGFFLRRAEVRSWRQRALRGRPAEGIKSPQSGGCGNQFVESRWPYLDGLVSLDGHVVGAGLGIRWTRAVVGARGRRATAIRAFATSEFERQALDLDPLSKEDCEVVGTEVEFARRNCDHDLSSHDLAFHMGISVVLAGSVMAVARNGFMRGEPFEPRVVIGVQTPLVVVDEHRCGDVHGVDEREAFSDATLL